MYESRIKVYNGKFDYSYTYENYYPDGAVIKQDYKGSTLTSFTRTDYRQGVKNPNFKQLISEGKSATTPFDAVKFQAPETGESPFRLNCRIEDPRYNNPRIQRDIITSVHSGVEYLSAPVVPNWDYGATQNRAAIKIRQKIDQQTNKFAGVTFLGELRESIAMLRSPAKGLLDYAKTFNGKMETKVRYLKSVSAKANSARAKAKARENFRNALSDLWLEFSFGWTPLAADVVGIIELIQKDALKNSRLTSWHEDIDVVRDALPRGKVLPVGTGNPIVELELSRVRTRTTRVRYIVGYSSQWTQPPEDSLAKLREFGGFTPSAAVLALYDLTPWSFLVDYFFTLGDVLQANLTSMDGVNWVNQTVHRKEEIEIVVNALFVPSITRVVEMREYVPGAFKTSAARVTRGAGSIPFGYPTF